ncbi:hypothetical protein GC170_18095 [bacterium]|nr:hypothetical protein [bacterium]
MRTDLEPQKKVDESLPSHLPLTFNWFEAKGAISTGVVEAMNIKMKLVTRKSYGFRRSRVEKLALSHNPGKLHEPDHLHKFC